MNKKLAFLLSFVILFGATSFVFADTVSLPNPLCPQGSGNPGCVDSFPTLIAQLTTYVTTIIGALAVLMFVWAGILFVTSAGNEERLGKAKKAMLWAVIGVAVSLAGAGLVLVVRNVIGTTPPP